MMRPQLATMAVGMALAAIFGLGLGANVVVPGVTQAPPPPPLPPRNLRGNQTRSRMPNNFRVRYTENTADDPKNKPHM